MNASNRYAYLSAAQQEIVNAFPELPVKGSVLTYLRTRHNLTQLGRSMALIEAGWHLHRDGALMSGDQSRIVAASLDGRDAYVSEFDAEAQMWKPHLMQRIFRVKPTRNAQGQQSGWKVLDPVRDQSLSPKSDYLLSQGFLGSGGRWNGGAWLWQGNLPVQVAALISIPRLTKYHFVWAQLRGGVAADFMGDLMLDLTAQKEIFIEGYRKELWVIAGNDYRDYPRLSVGNAQVQCDLWDGYMQELAARTYAELA